MLAVVRRIPQLPRQKPMTLAPGHECFLKPMSDLESILDSIPKHSIYFLKVTSIFYVRYLFPKKQLQFSMLVICFL